MTDDHDSELDALLAQLEAADLEEQYVNDDGKPAMRLTPNSAQLGRYVALAGEDDAGAVLDALLDGEQVNTGQQ